MEERVQITSVLCPPEPSVCLSIDLSSVLQGQGQTGCYCTQVWPRSGETKKKQTKKKTEKPTTPLDLRNKLQFSALFSFLSE